MNDSLKIQGSCLIQAVSVESGKLIRECRYKNSILSAYILELVQDIRRGVMNSVPKALAFSRELIASSPEPSNLGGGEFRVPTSRFFAANRLVLVAVLASHQGNGAGPIRSVGFYFGDDATAQVGTGLLGSIINTVNEVKDPTVELSFQYEITFGEL